MTYACPEREFAADSYVLKLRRLQNKVLHTIGNLPRRTLTRDLHMAFKIPYYVNSLQNYAGSKQQSY
jgi:hypothetical protein